MQHLLTAIIISISTPLSVFASATNGQFAFHISVPLEAFPDFHRLPWITSFCSFELVHTSIRAIILSGITEKNTGLIL